MLSLIEAQRQILEVIRPLDPELAPVSDAEGRILRENLVAPLDLPAIDTSAVDGYAVRSEDIRSASEENPVFLSMTAQIAAGQPAVVPVLAGACQRLYTGAMMPPGADAVVMQEDTVIDPQGRPRVGIKASATPCENVRFRGEDVRCGTVVASAGDRLGFGHVTLLSALGITGIQAGRRPVVSIVATGSELCEAGTVLGPGRIYESNRAGLACLVRKCGGLAQPQPIARDRLDDLSAALERAFAEADVVVSAGGVSVGDLDLVRPAFTGLGGEILFWKVAIRPGKPFVFGSWRGKLFFGLPGNPVSAAVCFWVLVRPAILALQGAAEVSPRGTPSKLGEPLANRGDRPQFVRVRRGADGRLHSAGAQGSHILGSLASSAGLVEVPANQTLAAGSEVTCQEWC